MLKPRYGETSQASAPNSGACRVEQKQPHADGVAVSADHDAELTGLYCGDARVSYREESSNHQGGFGSLQFCVEIFITFCTKFI